MSIILSKTKAEVLESLEEEILSAKILPQVRFYVNEWIENHNIIINRIKEKFQSVPLLIIRSSAANEDSYGRSMAGSYKSIGNINDESMLKSGIEKVAESMANQFEKNQIFVQPMLSKVKMGGVVFTRDPSTGGYYIIINYDDYSGKTNTITSGKSQIQKTYYYDKTVSIPPENELARIITLTEELENLFGTDSLNIEFAITEDNILYLLQVRSLLINTSNNVTKEIQRITINEIGRKIGLLNQPHPYLFGGKTIYGIMPDWNPAEIIGIRPKPLALSLYKDLITDSVWACQRDNYGYLDLRSFPLLINFAGLPYIDVRVSFNSFIPSDMDCNLAERLVNYYIDRLIEYPAFHDKVESEIVYSCYTLDLPEKLIKLKGYGFSTDDCNAISQSLLSLTNTIISEKTGLWTKDTEKVKELENRQSNFNNNNLDPVTNIYWILEDCKRYGTLPFAGLARAGFIAMQLLDSLVKKEILSKDDFHLYMNSLNTIQSSMICDLCDMKRMDFLVKYGHLRPGTYDILSTRYDETPDQYFDWSEKSISTLYNHSAQFKLSDDKRKDLDLLLKNHNLNHDGYSLFKYITEAIQAREYAKFIFSKSLSNAIKYFSQFTKEFDISREDTAYANISVIKHLYGSSDDPAKVLKESISHGKKMYQITRQINLPPLIISKEDIFHFHLPVNEPNYITMKSKTGKVVKEITHKSQLQDNILMLSNADPGYDWIFSHKPGGFITMYGGCNSHMAIRANELGIPAVIGAGEVYYRKWSYAKILKIDCANKKVYIIQ